MFVALVAAVSCSYPPNDDGRCKVGLTLNGLGVLDGDYMDGRGNFYIYAAEPRPALLTLLAYTYTFHFNKSAYGGDSYGCDHFGGWGPQGACSAADSAMTRGKWAIFLLDGPVGQAKPTVAAVCEGGCPNWSPDCKDLFNGSPDDPPILCPLWPNKWQKAQTWRILNGTLLGTQLRSANVTSNCCERQPQECDPCSYDTCSDLTTLFSNTCPPHKPSPQKPLTKLQSDCCQTEGSGGPLPHDICACKVAPTVCKH